MERMELTYEEIKEYASRYCTARIESLEKLAPDKLTQCIDSLLWLNDPITDQIQLFKTHRRNIWEENFNLNATGGQDIANGSSLSHIIHLAEAYQRTRG